jgi:hypothetical protein
MLTITLNPATSGVPGMARRIVVDFGIEVPDVRDLELAEDRRRATA